MGIFSASSKMLRERVKSNVGDEAVRNIRVSIAAFADLPAVTETWIRFTGMGNGQRPFDLLPGHGDAPERNAEVKGVFLPSVPVRVGQRITVLEPEDMAGQVWEVVVPFRARRMGYRVGLAFVSGNR